MSKITLFQLKVSTLGECYIAIFELLTFKDFDFVTLIWKQRTRLAHPLKSNNKYRQREPKSS